MAKHFKLKDGTKLSAAQVELMTYTRKPGATLERDFNRRTIAILQGLSFIELFRPSVGLWYEWQIQLTPAGTAALTELGLITPAAPEAPAPAVDTFGVGNFEIGQRVEVRFLRSTEFGTVISSAVHTVRSFNRVIQPDKPAYEGQTYTMNTKDLREVDDTDTANLDGEQMTIDAPVFNVGDKVIIGDWAMGTVAWVGHRRCEVHCPHIKDGEVEYFVALPTHDLLHVVDLSTPFDFANLFRAIEMLANPVEDFDDALINAPYEPRKQPVSLTATVITVSKQAILDTDEIPVVVDTSDDTPTGDEIVARFVATADKHSTPIGGGAFQVVDGAAFMAAINEAREAVRNLPTYNNHVRNIRAGKMVDGGEYIPLEDDVRHIVSGVGGRKIHTFRDGSIQVKVAGQEFAVIWNTGEFEAAKWDKDEMTREQIAAWLASDAHQQMRTAAEKAKGE